MEQIKFTADVCNKIGYYVYRLVDPTNGQTFYVGKGKSNRVFDHVHCAEKLLSEVKAELESEQPNEKVTVSLTELKSKLKFATIRNIKEAGLEVVHIIHRWGLNKDEAFLVEAAVMDCYAGLTNEQNGHDSEHGVINSKTLQATLSKTEFEEPDNIEEFMIIKVKQKWLDVHGGDRYETTRYCWRLNPENARKHPYVLSVTDGIVKEIYYAEEWRKVTQGDATETGRYEFIGHVVTDEKIRERFIDHRIPSKYSIKGQASPTLYCKK